MKMEKIYVWQAKQLDQDQRDICNSLEKLFSAIQSLRLAIEELSDPLTQPFISRSLENLSMVEELFQKIFRKLNQSDYSEAYSTWNRVQVVFRNDVVSDLRVAKLLKETPKQEELLVIDMPITSRVPADRRLFKRLQSWNKQEVVVRDTGRRFLGGGFEYIATIIAVGANVITIVKFLSEWLKSRKKTKHRDRARAALASALVIPSKKSPRIVIRTESGEVTVEKLSEENIQKLVERFLEKGARSKRKKTLKKV